jgi:hypothetical protein
MKFRLLTIAAALSLCNVAAAAQSPAASPATQQQQTPPKPPQDLFAQVPTPKPEDVKSVDASWLPSTT